MTEKNSIVIYHDACADGFAAAYAAWLKLGDSAEYLPLQYGDAPPAVHGKSVYILDFSFSQPVMEQLEQEARRVVLLDHHATAIDKLTDFTCQCGMLRLARTGVQGCLPEQYLSHNSHVQLNTKKSGARLAWEYFHGQYEVPDIILYVEDRDLWKWRYGANTRHFLAKLDSLPYTFDAWRAVHEMSEQSLERFMAQGAAMCEKLDAICLRIVEDAVPLTLMGHAGLMVNAPRELASEVGSLLAKQSGTFGAVWHLEPAGQLKFSLRSLGFNVRSIAEAFGGGGHPTAASLRLSPERFPDVIRGHVEPI